MKKNLLALFAATAVALTSSLSFAAPAAIVSGAEITAGSTGTCVVLGESVRLNLSKGVFGAFNCDETRNAINVGACHEAGSRSTSLTCAQIGVDANNNPTFNNASCNTGNVGTAITITTPSYRGYRASSTGGSVGAQSLSGNCATATPTSELVNFQ